MNYYAVRYKSAPDQIRIEKADTPERAFRLAFGHPPQPTLSSSGCEYKDLGTRVGILRSNKRRIAALKEPQGWIEFARKSHMNVKFNINGYVRVRLTQVGLNALKAQHESLATMSKWEPPAVDSNGYSRFQLWDLMERLGRLCHNGGSIPFETTIVLESGS